MTIGAVLGWWALSARASGLCPPSTEHWMPGAWDSRGIFPCLPKCLPGPRLDFHRVLRRVLILSGLTQPFQKAIQEGSGVGCYWGNHGVGRHSVIRFS